MFGRLARPSLVALATAALVAPLLVHAPPAAGATTFVVTTTADGGPGSLRAAVGLASDAPGEDVVQLAAGATYELTDCSPAGGDLDHAGTDVLIIAGAGATIVQHCPNQRVLHTHGGVILQDVTIRGGSAIGPGGGLYSQSGPVVVERSVIEQNESDQVGGGIYATDALQVIESIVRDNEAWAGGGGVRGATVLVDESSVVRNQVDPDVGIGGGVQSHGSVNVVRSFFAGNQANEGGAIATSTALLMATSTVHANRATANGGGVITYGGAGALIEASVLARNASPAGQGANVVTAGDLYTHSSTYADPDTGEDCAIAGFPVSTGRNTESSDSCGFQAVADLQHHDPDLRAPFLNGGRTPSMHPPAGSVLLDRIPTGAPGCVSDAYPIDADQRGVSRPQGSGCDVGSVEVAPCGVPFSDVGATHPFCWEIGWLAGSGVSTGYAGGTYRPGAVVTRQAMSAFMYRLAGEPPFSPPASPTFTDVGTGHPFYAAIEWMAHEDITTGFPGNTYRPGAVVTRQAMSAFMYRLAGEPPFSPPASPTFTDVGTGHPFYAAIEWMAHEDITTGFPGNTYRPGADVTRQAMSAFMYRLADGHVDQSAVV